MNRAVIRTLDDLCEFFCADSVTSLNRRIWKDTECGASISVRTPDGVWHHNGQDWSGITAIDAFTIQTAVEGSDATVDSAEFTLPIKAKVIDAWLEDMESEAARLWNEANEAIDGTAT